MTSFIEHMSTYAKYHRDPRNILTHVFGVPIIVFSVIVLLSRPTLFVVEALLLLLPLSVLFWQWHFICD